MICLPISAETNDELRHLLTQAESQPADVIELRLDFLKEAPDFSRLVPAHLPLIVSCRSRADGGEFQGTESERRAILCEAARAGVQYIEAEAVDVAAVSPHKKNATLIACMHDFHGTPDDLERRAKRLADLPADWIKIVVTYTKPEDNLRILSLIRTSPKPCIGVCMGEAGLVTRILGKAAGSPITYANRDAGFEAAPGVPTAGDLANIYRVGEITDKTKIYGLLGSPITQSRSYRIFNRAFDISDFDAVYIPFRCDKVIDFLQIMPKGINLHGLSITTPHKVAALKWADEASPNAQRIGSANTLTRTESGWRANNSDLPGAFESLKSMVDNLGMNLMGVDALVLGAGGTTPAVGLALSLLGCKITIAARNPDAAWRIAGGMDWDVEDLPTAVTSSQWGVVANTTLVGMYPNPDESLFPASGWREGMVGFDVVFNPSQTRFLKEAAAAGAITVDGLEMYLHQMARQFELWTGKKMPRISSLTWSVR